MQIESGGKNRTVFKTDHLEEYVIEQMRKSILSVNKDIDEGDIYVGFEFEFYLNEGRNISDMIKNISVFANKIVFCPNECNTGDKDFEAWTIERDASLIHPFKDGFEIVSPKLKLSESIFNLISIIKLISVYGHTDENCSLHFHISSENSKLKELDPVKLMLFINNTENLSSWKERKMMSLDLSKIFKSCYPKEFKENFSKLPRYYNISPRNDFNTENHLEVRAIGGESYELKQKEILLDYIEFVKNYYAACNPDEDNELYKVLLKNFYEENKESFKSKINFDDILNETKKTIENFDKLDRNNIKMHLFETILEKADKNDRLIVPSDLEKDLTKWIDKKKREDEISRDENINLFMNM